MRRSAGGIWVPPNDDLALPPDSLLREAICSDDGLDLWARGYGVIRNKAKALQRFEAKALQRDQIDCIQHCLKERVPCRMLSLKRRQGGGSTGCMLATNWLLRRSFGEGCVIADAYKRTTNLLEMVRTAAANDRFDWGHDVVPGLKEIRYGNGSKLRPETGDDKNASRSYTYTVVVATEIARWNESGAAAAEEIMIGLLGSQPKLPGTLAILDTTALGPSGYFYDLWGDATDWEDIKSGRVKAIGQWIRVFAGYHTDEDSRMPLAPGTEPAFEKSLDEEERLLRVTYSLPLEVLNFRRYTIRYELKRRKDVFKREYPHTPEEAFSASSPSVFNPDGLIYLEGEARKQERLCGRLETQKKGGRLTWVPDNDDAAFFWLWEKPQVGHRYFATVDVMSGEANDEAGDDRDNHAAGIWREGYRTREGLWHPLKLVARTKADCQLKLRVLAERIAALLQWYGNCMCIPEANNHGLALIVYLRQMECLLYERRTGDSRINSRSSKGSGQYGVLTTGGGEQTEGSKAYCIEQLDHLVREWDTDGDGIDIPCVHTLAEMRTFVQAKDGTYGAMAGKHDDSVTMCWIAAAYRDQATELTADKWEQAKRVTDPYLQEELAEARRHRRREALRGYS